MLIRKVILCFRKDNGKASELSRRTVLWLDLYNKALIRVDRGKFNLSALVWRFPREKCSQKWPQLCKGKLGTNVYEVTVLWHPAHLWAEAATRSTDSPVGGRGARATIPLFLSLLACCSVIPAKSPGLNTPCDLINNCSFPVLPGYNLNRLSKSGPCNLTVSNERHG